GLVEELREALRLIAREDDPAAVGLPALDGIGDPGGAAGGELRLTPAEEIAGAQTTRGERGALGNLGFPGQLERPARNEPALPVTGSEVRRRPVLRQVTALDELGPPFVRLAPQEVRGLGDLAGLVEDEER